MNDENLNKLAGQIRGLEEAFISVISALEINGTIDGANLTQYLRQWSEQFRPETDSPQLLVQVKAAQKTIHYLTDQIDGARTRRQSKLR